MIFALALTFAAAASPASCPARNQLEINDCVAAELNRADGELARYVAAARRRLQADQPDVLRAFDDAQSIWRSYREVACGAVYREWENGSIRNVKALECEQALVRERTRAIWRDWLTYEDWTPPILPEPR